MILLVGGEKGGTGKSTLATNIAVWLARNNQDTLLLDTDPQGSASGWAATRIELDDLPPVHSVQKTGDVFTAVKDLSARYDQVIIDAGGRDSRELRSAMLAAERMIVPIKPSQFDLWTVDRLDELIQQALAFNHVLKTIAVVSMAPTHHQIKETDDAREMLAEFEHLHLSDCVICDRKVYRDAIIEGRGVLEMSNRKAIDEVENLAQEVYRGHEI